MKITFTTNIDLKYKKIVFVKNIPATFESKSLRELRKILRALKEG